VTWDWVRSSRLAGNTVEKVSQHDTVSVERVGTGPGVLDWLETQSEE